MLNDAAAFGRLIRSRRRDAGLSQRNLAAAVDSGERFIVDLEAGKPSCQLGKALSVAHALGIKLADCRAYPRAEGIQDDELPDSARGLP